MILENYKQKATNLFFSLLIFLPTIVNIGNTIYIILFLIGLYQLPTFTKSNKSRLFQIFVLFVFLSSIVFYISLIFSKEIQDKVNGASSYIPIPLSILCCILFAKTGYINNVVFKWIILFICIEIVVGLVEYKLGIYYLIKPSSIGDTDMTSFGSDNLLYYSRVYGLSSNSSVLALKAFVAILLNFIVFKRKWINILVLCVCFACLFVTFNRTAIISTSLFLILYYLKTFKKSYIFLSLIGLVVLFILIYHNYELIFSQFNRGQTTLDTSDRGVIIGRYLDYINVHPFFGNYFHELRLVIFGTVLHSHNSFTQITAQCGIIFFILLMVLIFNFLNKSNYVFIIPILVYSLTQFGIFWGISFLDIIFFYLLFKINTSFFQSSIDLKLH